MTEVWRDVPGLEGEYQVSDAGRVRSLQRKVPAVMRGKRTFKTVPARVLRPGRMNKFGHLSVVLGGRSLTVHSLVLAAFVGPRPEGCDVAHNNGDGSDNRLTNLRYASRSDNNRDMVFHGKTRLSAADVLRIRSAAGKMPRGWKKRMAESLGVSQSTISDVLAGRSYSHV